MVSATGISLTIYLWGQSFQCQRLGIDLLSVLPVPKPAGVPGAQSFPTCRSKLSTGKRGEEERVGESPGPVEGFYYLRDESLLMIDRVP